MNVCWTRLNETPHGLYFSSNFGSLVIFQLNIDHY
jgi:hypothetical protein